MLYSRESLPNERRRKDARSQKSQVLQVQKIERCIRLMKRSVTRSIIYPDIFRQCVAVSSLFIHVLGKRI
jgi:hypothetical protein